MITKARALLVLIPLALGTLAFAAAALSESLGRVTSRVKAVSDFIETRRGAVGAEAGQLAHNDVGRSERSQRQRSGGGGLSSMAPCGILIDAIERGGGGGGGRF